MDIVHVLVVLVIVGVVLWLVQTYIPMPQPIKVVITVVVLFEMLALDPSVTWTVKPVLSVVPGAIAFSRGRNDNCRIAAWTVAPMPEAEAKLRL